LDYGFVLLFMKGISGVILVLWSRQQVMRRTAKFKKGCNEGLVEWLVIEHLPSKQHHPPPKK
jgi:hypothetical protein